MVNVVEDFGSTLARADNGHLVWLISLGKQLGHHVGVLRGVDDLRMLEREALGEAGTSTGGQEDVVRLVRLDMARLCVLRLNDKLVHGVCGIFDGRYSNNLLVELDQVAKEGRAPSQVVFVFHAGWQESAQVGKVDQSVLLVEVVEERKLGARITERGQVLDKGNLHLGAGQQHAGVPSKSVLLLDKEHLGGRAVGTQLLAALHGIVQSNRNGQTGRAKADTDKIKLVIERRGVEMARLVVVDAARSGDLVVVVSSTVAVYSGSRCYYSTVVAISADGAVGYGL